MVSFDKPRYLSGYTLYKSLLNPRISKLNYYELRDYAKNMGIFLEDFKDYTGDIQEIKNFIDKIVVVADDFPLLLQTNKSVRLKLYFTDLKHNPDFAYSENHIIAINGMMYNDSNLAKMIYDSEERTGNFVKGTTYKDVPFHELGHIVCNMYQLDSLKIAKKISGIESISKLIVFLKDNLSLYSAAMNESGLISKHPVFDGEEIIAESFCAYYGKVKNNFAIDYINECKRLIEGR